LDDSYEIVPAEMVILASLIIKLAAFPAYGLSGLQTDDFQQ